MTSPGARPPRVSGSIRVPGDKSISHRALMLAALAEGASTVRGILPSADVRSTAAVLRSLGVPIPDLERETVSIAGVGRSGLRTSAAPLDCGNSGTTARLMAGILAASPFTSSLVGDASLSRRPMRRVAAPLQAMGATIAPSTDGGLPMTIHGGPLRGLTWHSETASAQVKSAILLAGLVADVPVEVHEPADTRDHTERMLRTRGIDVRSEGGSIALVPGATLLPLDTEVPGDPSSAAFFVALAAMSGGGTIELEHVGINPTRTGAFNVLTRMGASIGFEDFADVGGEPVARLVVSPRVLGATTIEPQEVPSLIDELPILACVAARAQGETRVTGAGELRVKESDRIAVVVRNLRAVGVDADELPDGFVVRGSDRPLAGRVVTHGDHRIAMAFGVLSVVSGRAIEIDDRDCAIVSFPGFWEVLAHVTR